MFCHAAVVGDKETAPPRYGSTYTEEDWNTTSAAQQEHYWVSKVLAAAFAVLLGPVHFPFCTAPGRSTRRSTKHVKYLLTETIDDRNCM